MVYDYLEKNYEKGEPIFLSDLKIEGMTDENIRYHLKKLTDDGIICRFESGVYYMPKKDIFGENAILSVEIVAIRKYIKRHNKRVGFYSGYTLANKLGLSTQVPFTQEITSNFAPATVRKIQMKNKNYIIRKPVVLVTDENAKILQFLDCLKDIEKYAEEDMETCGKILSDYIIRNEITKTMVDKYVTYYPLKIYKALYETGVTNVLA